MGSVEIDSEIVGREANEDLLCQRVLAVPIISLGNLLPPLISWSRLRAFAAYRVVLQDTSRRSVEKLSFEVVLSTLYP